MLIRTTDFRTYRKERSYGILVRLTKEERDEINKGAARNSDSQAGFVRRRLGLTPYPTSKTAIRQKKKRTFD